MQSLHPLVVHFPIALLLCALGCDVLALLIRRPALHRVALWNLALGALGAVAAVLTGREAEEVAKHSFEIFQVMERHERLGYDTLTLACLTLGWRLWRRDQLGRRARVGTLILMGLMAASLAYGAHLGGRLVYEFGVGGTFGAAPARADGEHAQPAR